MKILFIADARSPIAKNWISYFIGKGHDVHVISSYPCAPDILPGVEPAQIPIAFARFARNGNKNGVAGRKSSRLVSTLLRSSLGSKSVTRLLSIMWLWSGGIEIQRHIVKVYELIEKIAPDFVHAMRIPFEGILAAKTVPQKIPLLTSVWGNDFTLHASRRSPLKRLTRQTLQRTDALHCDCARDVRLAREFGFGLDKPTIVLPGAGGIQANIFCHGGQDSEWRRRLNIPEYAPVIINPRGFRGHARNDVFFRVIPRVLKIHPETIFVCSGMAGNKTAETWISQFGIKKNVRLLPNVSRDEMADLFRLAAISISPSLHDGTPNTLLEAMACGCFPVAGEIESVREWIENQMNGLLCDPTNDESLAQTIIRALQDEELRERAKDLNAELIAERAEYDAVMTKAEDFYLEIIEIHKSTITK
ncbi:MAG: hypothetical protein NVSMB56_06820 [Pyrinomonadaceae bacterium]